MKNQGGLARLFLTVIIALAAFGWLVPGLYRDWLWFQHLGFLSVFVTMLSAKALVGLVAGAVFLIAVGVNYAVARHYVARVRPITGRRKGISVEGLPISEKAVSWAIGAFLVIVALMIASAASTRWSLVLMYFHPKSFGVLDPVFGRDVAFFVFSLPFYLFVRDWLLGFLIFSGLVALMVYGRGNLVRMELGTLQGEEGAPQPPPKLRIDGAVRNHLSILGILLLAILIWGYQLKGYQLLYSTRGPAFGASYTDVHVQLIAYKLLMVVLGAFGALLVANIIRYRKGVVLVGLASTLGLMVVAGSIVPSLIQKVLVKPNELNKERPYIAYNIQNTRRAYGLDRIQERDFIVDEDLTMTDIRRNRMTVENIRIWDERPLKETYGQIQSIRSYYSFSGIDVDRYSLNGRYRQVTLSAREISVDQLSLQARTWVNRHLVYTHGYGLALNPVNVVTQEGLPDLWIKDLPPVSRGLKITRPEIYYGEKTDDYVIVRTKEKEFDYPKGDSNVYATYEGDGGVPLDSFVRRLLFAVTFRSTDILFTGYLTPESRIMFYRNIRTRIEKIAPFLQFDRDPYLVLADGRLFWMLDGYTTTSMYPYSSRMSQKFGFEINYIRNSIKATIDAYTGRIALYVIDDTDPIIRSFKEIFPALFQPIAKMPEVLKAHIRYPRDLFDIQAAMYRQYHMQDVQVFYNQEDLWQVPNEVYADTHQQMVPYYIIIRLPGETREEFLLMLPFTPSEKDNMIAWLAARSDMPNYGDLLVYKLPKKKLIFGPMQVEARVDQQTDISRELTLWGQKGSRVIRGNLMAIPIEKSFIYVEPVYLQAAQNESQSEIQQAGRGAAQPFGSQPGRRPRSMGIPELKRVIVAYGKEVVMTEDLAAGLAAIFEPTESRVKRPAGRKAATGSLGELAVSALAEYRRAQEALRAGDWAGYGQALKRMESLLEELATQESRGRPPAR